MTTETRHPMQDKTLARIDQRLTGICPDKPEVKLKVIITVRNGVPRRLAFEECDEESLN